MITSRETETIETETRETETETRETETETRETETETETLINKRRKCESCRAAEGKKHPYEFFVVHLRKRIINGRMISLCQRCRNKAQGRFHDKEFKTDFFPQ